MATTGSTTPSAMASSSGTATTAAAATPISTIIATTTIATGSTTTTTTATPATVTTTTSTTTSTPTTSSLSSTTGGAGGTTIVRIGPTTTVTTTPTTSRVASAPAATTLVRTDGSSSLLPTTAVRAGSATFEPRPHRQSFSESASPYAHGISSDGTTSPLDSIDITDFISDMGKLYSQSILTDTVFLVGPDEEEFRVHRSLLAARSEYFRIMFTNGMREARDSVIRFPEKDPKVFGVLMDYFYKARLNITHKNAFEVMKLADEYGITRVKEKCIKYVKEQIDEENAFGVFEESRFYRYIELHQYCQQYIEQNAKKLFGSEKFLQLTKDALIDLLESDKIQLHEIEIFKAVIEWGKAQLREEQEEERARAEELLFNSTAGTDSGSGRGRQQIIIKTEQVDDTQALARILHDVLHHVRFPTLTPSEIFDHVEPTGVVPSNLLLEAYRYHALSDRITSFVDHNTCKRYKIREGSLFYVPGVQENISLKLLRGWHLCYHAPYSDKTTSKVFERCKGPRILVGAKHKNSNALALCAMGRLEYVTRETFENETTKENNVYWYHWTAHSFGFSATEHINLGSADLADGTHRLSWHLTGRGGYRVGEIKNLNESDDFEKLIFYSN